MTDLPDFTGDFDGTELFEVVAPGNVAQGVNYSVTSLRLALLFAQVAFTQTIITTRATLGDPYDALPSDLRVLLNKSVPSPSYVDIGGGAGRTLPIMVRDLLGDAETNNITVSFTGTCDGLASPIVINANYGGYTFNPLPSGNWYLTNT